MSSWFRNELLLLLLWLESLFSKDLICADVDIDIDIGVDNVIDVDVGVGVGVDVGVDDDVDADADNGIDVDADAEECFDCGCCWSIIGTDWWDACLWCIVDGDLVDLDDMSTSVSISATHSFIAGRL